MKNEQTRKLRVFDSKELYAILRATEIINQAKVSTEKLNDLIHELPSIAIDKNPLYELKDKCEATIRSQEKIIDDIKYKN